MGHIGADARKIPGVAIGSRLAAPAACTMPSRSAGREGQSGLRLLAPTLELANDRLWRPPPRHQKRIKESEDRRSDTWVSSNQTDVGEGSLHLDNGEPVFYTA